MARSETISADRNSPLSLFLSMLMRHRDILDLAVDRDEAAAAKVDHEGPTPEAVASLAEQRRWGETRRIWTRLDIQHRQHEAHIRAWGVGRRAWRLVKHIRSRKPVDVYRAAKQEAIDDGTVSYLGPLMRDAWRSYEAFLVAAEEGNNLGNMVEGPMHDLNHAVCELLDETKPPGPKADNLEYLKDGTERKLGRLILACIDKHGHVASQQDLLGKMADEGRIESAGSVSGPLSAMKKAGILKGWNGNHGYTRNS